MPGSSSSLVQALIDLLSQLSESSIDLLNEVDMHVSTSCSDNTTIWNSNWTMLCSDLVRVILNSGLKLPATATSAIIDESCVKVCLANNKLLGPAKVTKLNTYLHIIIHALCALLHYGCESGPVSLIMDLLLPAVTTVLSMSIRANSAHSKVNTTILNY